MKKLLCLIGLVFISNAYSASVEIEMERLGLTELNYFSRIGNTVETRLLDVLLKVQEDRSKHIVLTYTANTSPSLLQYNGNITAKIFKMPTDFTTPECIISLDISSAWENPSEARADLSDPGKIFPMGSQKCDYGI